MPANQVVLSTVRRRQTRLLLHRSNKEQKERKEKKKERKFVCRCDACEQLNKNHFNQINKKELMFSGDGHGLFAFEAQELRVSVSRTTSRRSCMFCSSTRSAYDVTNSRCRCIHSVRCAARLRRVTFTGQP